MKGVIKRKIHSNKLSAQNINYSSEIIKDIDKKIEIDNHKKDDKTKKRINQLLDDVREMQNAIDIKEEKLDKRIIKFNIKTEKLLLSNHNNYLNLKLTKEEFENTKNTIYASRETKLKTLIENNNWKKESLKFKKESLMIKNKQKISFIEDKISKSKLKEQPKMKLKTYFKVKDIAKNNEAVYKNKFKKAEITWEKKCKFFEEKKANLKNRLSNGDISLKKCDKEIFLLEKTMLKSKAKLERETKEKDRNKLHIYKFILNLRLLFSKNIFKKALVNFIDLVLTYKIIILILVFAIIVNILHPRFLSQENILGNILFTNVTIGFIAIGMTFVILTGGIDLSVGSLMAYTGAVLVSVYLTTGSLIFGVLAAISVAIMYGIVAGFLIARVKLQPFIVTLVGMLIFRGLTYMKLSGSPLTLKKSDFFDFLGSAKWGPIPATVVIFFIIAFVLIFVLAKTRYGRKVYATGGNADSAKMSGIKTKLIIMSVYIIIGILVVFAAMSFIGRLKSITPTAGQSYELDAIAAVVLGGTSLLGGRGGVGKTLIGWFTISLLSNAMIFLRIEPNTQLLVKGIVILVAILFDRNINIVNKVRIAYIKFVVDITSVIKTKNK